MPVLLFWREQMVRQRDALRSIFWWYLLPFFPGLLILMSAGGARPQPAGGEGATAGGLIVMCLTVSVFPFVWWLNQLAARKLQKQIDEIDELRGE
jgi:hypothetical protein